VVVVVTAPGGAPLVREPGASVVDGAVRGWGRGVVVGRTWLDVGRGGHAPAPSGCGTSPP